MRVSVCESVCVHVCVGTEGQGNIHMHEYKHQGKGKDRVTGMSHGEVKTKGKRLHRMLWFSDSRDRGKGVGISKMFLDLQNDKNLVFLLSVNVTNSY